MPETIKSEHMNRMFPFEFYDELNEQLASYTLSNPAFLLHKKKELPTEKRREVFAHTRTEEVLERLNQHNILEAEPFGELLHLELCTKNEYVDQMLGNQTERSQVPLSILVGQLYDSSGAPVFSKDVTEETVAKIPEVLWDDPNLLLGIIEYGETETTVGIIRMPASVEARLFEPIDSK